MFLRISLATPTKDLATPKPHKNPVGRPRIHPIKTPGSRPTTKQQLSTPVIADTEESGDSQELIVPGKRLKATTRNNQKSLNSTPSNKHSNYNNIMLIKNEQIVSNSSSLKQLKAQIHLVSSPNSKSLTPVAHQAMLFETSSALNSLSTAECQQQNPSLGVSDRMSKEKQKFFRFSVFNSERKSKSVDGSKPQKSSLNNNKSKTNNNHKITSNGDASYDKYKFVSSSDSENECDTICDKTNKAKAKTTSRKLNPTASTKLKGKLKSEKKKPKTATSNSSCCSSEGDDSGSSSDTSTSSSGSSTSSSGSSSSENSSCLSPVEKNQKLVAKTSLANKAESINTMNVFACINSRELTSQTKVPPYCWTSMPSANEQQVDSLFRKQSTKSKSFGVCGKLDNEAWGFAAEAKKSLNIFTNSDSESRTHRASNYSGTDSDCQMSLLSLSTSIAQKRMNRKSRDNSSSRFTQKLPLIFTQALRKSAKTASNYLASNRRTTTLMRNNTIIMSSDDDAKQLSPSKLVQKAVNYKKFDYNTLNNKKLIMDTSLNGAKYGSDDRPVKEPLPANPAEQLSIQSQPPYNNNTNIQSDIGKKLKMRLP